MTPPRVLEKIEPIPSQINRRSAIRSTLAATVATSALSAAVHSRAAADKADARRASPKSYRMKKSINLWAFPYPQRMTLRECLRLAKDAGFDGIELNYDLDDDLSPKSSADHFHPFLHYPEALIEQSSDALDRIMGRKHARSRVT